MKKLHHILVPMLAVAFCSGCVGNGQAEQLRCVPLEHSFPDTMIVRMVMEHMSLEEKVGQLFVIRPEARAEADSISLVNPAYTMSQPQPAGYCLFAKNIKDPEQTKSFTRELVKGRFSPMLCIDEECGRVARIGGNPAFDVPRYKAAAIEARRGAEHVRDMARTIGTYLGEYGFHVDFAPVADVNTNPDNPVIGTRAFDSDPQKASEYMLSYMQGLQEAGIASCLKHFPGHGDTQTDSHLGYAESLKSWEQMLSCEMVTFRSGIAAGVPLVMVAHVTTPNADPSGLPATLSYTMMTEKLRGELGFDGVIITDSMGMGAISEHYSSDQAAVMALLAGADIVLMPQDYHLAFNGVLQAVKNGTLPLQRLDGSVARVLLLKRWMGIL